MSLTPELALSNISWPDEHDTIAFETLLELGVTAIDVAPTKALPLIKSQGIDSVSKDDVVAFTRRITSYGLHVSGMQSLTFQRPENIFNSSRESVNELKSYMHKVIRIGELIGARTLIYGSAGTRTFANLTDAQIEERAADFFFELDDVAANAGLLIGIEPISKTWTNGKAVFGNTGSEVIDFVSSMKHNYGTTALRFVPDTFAMHDASESPNAIITSAARAQILAPHMQIAEALMLEPEMTSPIDHAEFSDAFSSSDYFGSERAVVAIEMFSQSGDINFTKLRIAKTVNTVRKLYEI